GFAFVAMVNGHQANATSHLLERNSPAEPPALAHPAPPAGAPPPPPESDRARRAPQSPAPPAANLLSEFSLRTTLSPAQASSVPSADQSPSAVPHHSPNASETAA